MDGKGINCMQGMYCNPCTVSNPRFLFFNIELHVLWFVYPSISGLHSPPVMYTAAMEMSKFSLTHLEREITQELSWS